MKSLNKRTNSLGIEQLTTDELKSRFKARCVPLETDFHALIDVAEYGRRAVGLNPEQVLNINSGLMLDSSQQLLVKPNTAKGITVDGSGIGVNTSAGNGLTVDNSQLKVALNSAPGLELTGTGLKVRPNTAKGIAVDGSGVGVIANAGKGITVDGSGIGVNTSAGNGLTVDNSQLKVALNSAPGLELTGTGLKVRPNTAQGITVDGSGVGVDSNKIIALIHGCDLYAQARNIRLFTKSDTNPTIIYVYSSGSDVLMTHVQPKLDNKTISSFHGTQNFTGKNTNIVKTMIFETIAKEGSMLGELSIGTPIEPFGFYRVNTQFSKI
ncbi:hypothetical protein DP187_24260 [Enterobacter cloacae]|nr:hypothetical protein DP187_24260 [Enterobacter cloacae]